MYFWLEYKMPQPYWKIYVKFFKRVKQILSYDPEISALKVIQEK